MTQWITILALVISLGLNAWQFERNSSAHERGRAEELQRQLARVSLVAAMAQVDDNRLLGELNAMVERGRKARLVYQTKVEQLPAPTCAPGRERMDMANALIRGDE